MLPTQCVESSMHDQPDQLFPKGNASSSRLTRSDPGTDVHIAHSVSGRVRQGEGEHIGGMIMTLVLVVKPPHRVAPDEGDGDERIAPLLPEYRPDHSLHQRARQWQSPTAYHDLTHAQPIETP